MAAQTTRLSSISVLLAGILAAWRFMRLHGQIAAPSAPSLQALRQAQPLVGDPAFGWWCWWDQGLYLKSAVAWAHGITDPGMHWYMPGYSLMAAIFVRATPADPFMLLNLGCLLGTLWLFCGLSSRLLGVSFGVPLCACVFLVTSVLPARVLTAWVTPWTTTPETVCLYASLFASVRMIDRVSWRDAFLAGFTGGVIAGFRPVDCAILLSVLVATALPILLSRGVGRSSLLWAVAFGAMLAFFLIGAAYLAVWGPHYSPYLRLSQSIGFEPRLLPLRWVMLMVDPGELYPDGHGLASEFFWIPAGITGMVLTLLLGGAAQRAHVLVIGAVGADVAMFLMYRDLHPVNLWRFELYHYFTWSLPVFGLYALRLVVIGMRGDLRRPGPVLAAFLSTAALFSFKERLQQVAQLEPVHRSVLTLPQGLSSIGMTVTVPGHGPASVPAVHGIATIEDGRVFNAGVDFAIYVSQGLLRIVPLRPLPKLPTRIRLTDGTFLENGAKPDVKQQTFGLRWPIQF